nr:maleate cis-trans isomerase [Nitrosomonas sp.]
MSNDGKFMTDGWGSKARIGLITPHMDIVPEREFQILAPSEISIHVARVPLGWRGGPESAPIGLDAVRAFADPPNVDDAVAMLAAAPLNSIAYGFTSSSFLLGSDGDIELCKRLEGRSQGVPIVIPCQSVLVALQL